MSADAERILLGCSDTLPLDGGVGMARALGFRFLDSEDEEIGDGVDELRRLARIDCSRRDPRLEKVRIDAVVDWRSILLGSSGAAGEEGLVDEALVAQREEANLALTSALAAASGSDVSNVARSGAAGGLGATLQALLGARLCPFFAVISDYLALESSLETTDLMLLVDGETPPRAPQDSALAKAAREAKLRGIPVFAMGVGPDGGPGQVLAADLLLRVEPQRPSVGALATINSRSLVRAAEEAMHLVRTGRFARDSGNQI